MAYQIIGEKWFGTSKTVIASVIQFATTVLLLIGVNVTADEASLLAETATQAAIGLFSFINLVGALYGRFVAKDKVRLLP